MMLFLWRRDTCFPNCFITSNCFFSGYDESVSERRSPWMYCIWILNLSWLITFGVFVSLPALMRSFASRFVLRVLIFLSSCGCLYVFWILDFTILFLIRKIFASAPCDISF